MKLSSVSLILFFLISVTISCIATADEQQPTPSEKQQVAAVLDQLHLAAEKADSKNYFNCFANEAIYIGTDAGEHWSMQSFRRFVEPYFSQGRGWQYRPTQRNIYLDASGQFAWFDELLINPKYGLTRSSGALVKMKKQWKIVQYHLTIPIPNEIALDVVNQIKQADQQHKKVN